MPSPLPSHPDRLAATLANFAAAHAARTSGPFAAPGAGAADCRIDLKLLQWRALRAAERSPAAREHLARWPAERHPDLWAGTVQDGAARGFAVHLEEAIALAQPEPDAQPAAFTPTRTLIGKELRRHKDLLVASSGARLRFTKKQGFVFTQRDRGPTSVDCVWFEARRDQGSLDDFVPALDERARLFSARSLQAIEYAVGDGGGRLVLDGRLGRGPIGWPLRLVLAAHADDERLRLTVHLGDAMPGFRVRVRWLGIGAERVQHECMPVREVVANDHGGFVADTLVRAATTLLVDGEPLATPAAACRGGIEHTFVLG